MSVAVRPRWGLPHLALSGLTAAVVAASPLGVLETLRTVDLTHIGASLRPAAQAADGLVVPADPAAPPFVLHAKSLAEHKQAVHCLAQAIYFEAGFQPVEGQRAVAQVVVNRVRDRDFPKTVCGVVYEGWRRHTGCQFSFVCDGSLRRRAPTLDEMTSAAGIAEQALGGYVEASVGTATHYHTWRVSPGWRNTLVQTAQIGDHIFYRWPGKAGRPQFLDAERYAGGEVRVAQSSPRQALDRLG